MTSEERQQVSSVIAIITIVAGGLILSEKLKVMALRKEAKKGRLVVNETNRLFSNINEGKYDTISELREDLQFSNIIFQEYLKE